MLPIWLQRRGAGGRSGEVAERAELSSLCQAIEDGSAAERFAQVPGGESFQAVRRRIGLDAARAGGLSAEPAHRRQASLARLVRLLEAHAVRDPWVGYCQGMTDLLEPFLTVFPDDAEALMCFSALMARVRRNFEPGQEHMRRQMRRAVELVRLQDRRLHRHLVRIGAADGLWAFRMLLVLMRREVPLPDILPLWEMLWAAQSLAGDAGGDLMAAAVAAYVMGHRRRVLRFSSADEVLLLCNHLPEPIHPARLMRRAVGMLRRRPQRRPDRAAWACCGADAAEPAARPW
uniref:Tbc domain-containing protein n=1 Tax=Tetraselmis sp. GSL018 TaxID=582737 RepID=A0A061RER9_9CHLO